MEGSSPIPPWPEEEGEAALPKSRYFPFFFFLFLSPFLFMRKDKEGDKEGMTDSVRECEGVQG
jgi:hypothetical protein